MAQTTKKALASTLKQLLTHKTLDKITVSDLTELCGVNRQTFYYHFRDLYDLLEWIYKEEAIKVLPSVITNENWSAAYLRLFEYLQDNRNFIMNTYRSAYKDLVLGYVYREGLEIMRTIIDYNTEGIQVSEEDRDFLARFYQYSLVNVILEWLETGQKEDPKEIVRRVSVIMDGTLKAALVRLERTR